MNRVGTHLIFGSLPEPFLEAALQSVNWTDYVCAVNTAPNDSVAAQHEAVVRRVVPREKLRLGRLDMGSKFDFARARNLALGLADEGDYVHFLDADYVFYPEWQREARALMARRHDVIEAVYWHLMIYKDLWQDELPREILFTNEKGVRFEGAVHEQLVHPKKNIGYARSRFVHYGYVKPAREVFRRWQLYAEIENDPGRYSDRQPDDILHDRLSVCQPFWREHPPAAQETLVSYPSAPRSSANLAETPRNVGLVLLTWDNSRDLKECLASLATTRQPFKLCLVDNGSNDDSVQQVRDFAEENDVPLLFYIETDQSLATALNTGFNSHMIDDEIDYIGWIHPDMTFERNTWLECLRHAMDTHPEIAKLGSADLNDGVRSEDPWPANSQCYLIRKSALQTVGLFNESFLACGGFEDWEHNFRLLKVGKVLVWPTSLIRHNSMSTRSQHDNEAAAHYNSDLYYQLTGTRDPLV